MLIVHGPSCPFYLMVCTATPGVALVVLVVTVVVVSGILPQF